MFEVRLATNINKAGWHVAHIFNAKDRNVDFHSWDRSELVRRSARNIHPCNYFYIPKIDWRIHGGNPNVIAFFYRKFEVEYQGIWKDFLRLVGAVRLPPPTNESDYRYAFPASRIAAPSRQLGPANVLNSGQTPATTLGPSNKAREFAEQYSFSRLAFNADRIEPLAMDDKFCILTKKDGAFAMTKREFYETFPGVVRSISYQLNRIYHYRNPPRKALQFRLEINSGFRD